MAPRGAQEAPAGLPEPQKASKNAILSTNFGFWAESDFGAAQRIPRAAQEAPRAPREAPGMTQEAPRPVKRATIGPKRPPEGSRRPPEAPQRLPRSPQREHAGTKTRERQKPAQDKTR